MGPILRPAYVTLLLVFSLLLETRVLGQCEVQTLTIPNRTNSDSFGLAVSIDKDVALVGASGETCGGRLGCGAAYIFRFDGHSWVQQQRLVPSDAAELQAFGSSVAIDGNTLVIADVLNNCAFGIYCGAAYIFRYDGVSWLEERKLVASDSCAECYFGTSVAISKDAVVVGASRRPGAGSAYFFRFDEGVWRQEAEFMPYEARYYGDDVAVFGDLALVGAGYAEGGTTAVTYAYRFRDSTWALEQEITHAGGAGWHFALYEKTALLASSGTAYVYMYDGSWEEQQALDLSDPFIQNFSIYSLAVNEQFALVSIRQPDWLMEGNDRGVVFLFDFDGTTWNRRGRLHPSDATLPNTLGEALSLSENRAISSGIVNDCGLPSGCTTAYVFAVGPDCDRNGQADFCDIRDGGADDGNADGVPDECEVTVSMDIEPGKCPNEIKVHGGGFVGAALAGSEAFDVRQVDAESIELRRVDGVGAAVNAEKPKRRNPENKSPKVETSKSQNEMKLITRLGGSLAHPSEDRERIRDVATFRVSGGCQCADDGRDGFDDLILKFDAKELVEAFELGGEKPGTVVEVEVSGAMRGGTIFRATDCIVVGRHEEHGGR